VVKHEGKKPLGKSRLGRECIIKMYPTGIGWESVDSFNVIQVRDRPAVVASSIKIRDIFDKLKNC
jgi:hypothetical protein